MRTTRPARAGKLCFTIGPPPIARPRNCPSWSGSANRTSAQLPSCMPYRPPETAPQALPFSVLDVTVALSNPPQGQQNRIICISCTLRRSPATSHPDSAGAFFTRTAIGSPTWPQHRRRNPVSLHDRLPGIDRRKATFAVKAIAGATGQAIAATR